MKNIFIFLFVLSFSICNSQISIHTVNVATNDLVYDSITNKIYVTIPSSNGSNGNSIGVINPNTYLLENTIFMGSEPSIMAISDDGQFIYTGFNGAATIRKFNVTTQTAGLQFPLGNDSFLGPYYAEDIEVIPGQPNSIAVARKYTTVSPRFAAVAIYDNGVVRPTVADWYGNGEISNQIEFKNSSLLFGYDNESTAYSFNNLVVNSSGVSLISGNAISGGFMSNANFVYAGNNHVYFPNGMSLDVSSTPFLDGTFPNVNGPVAYDITNNLVCFGINNSGNIIFKRFNANTFLTYDYLNITQAFGTVKKIISCGHGMYAMITSDDKVVIINDAALSNEKFTESKISVYPNPVINVLNFDAGNVQIESVAVYDMVGKKIMDNKILQNNIDLSFLETGIYIIELKDKNNNIFSNKFLKK